MVFASVGEKMQEWIPTVTRNDNGNYSKKKNSSQVTPSTYFRFHLILSIFFSSPSFPTSERQLQSGPDLASSASALQASRERREVSRSHEQLVAKRSVTCWWPPRAEAVGKERR